MKPENLAEHIRNACLAAVLAAHADAGINGLCAEGRWGIAVDALRTLDLAPLVREFQHHLALGMDAQPEKDRNTGGTCAKRNSA